MHHLVVGFAILSFCTFIHFCIRSRVCFTRRRPPDVGPWSTKLDHTNPNLRLALKKISLALAQQNIKWATIGSSALFFYAEHFNAVSLSTTHSRHSIDIIIQPYKHLVNNQKLMTSQEVKELLCNDVFFKGEFRKKKVFGPTQIQIVVKKGEGEEKDILIDLNIYDHWSSPEQRVQTDLSRKGNERIAIMNLKEKIYLMNAPWLLKQKIRLWGEKGRHKKWSDRQDIGTLCDVLEKMGRRARYSVDNEEDMQDLGKLIEGWEGGLETLRSGVECPEVLGPWWEVWWKKWCVTIIVTSAVLMVADAWQSEIDVGEKPDTLVSVLASFWK